MRRPTWPANTCCHSCLRFLIQRWAILEILLLWLTWFYLEIGSNEAVKGQLESWMKELLLSTHVMTFLAQEVLTIMKLQDSNEKSRRGSNILHSKLSHNAVKGRHQRLRVLTPLTLTASFPTQVMGQPVVSYTKWRRKRWPNS